MNYLFLIISYYIRNYTIQLKKLNLIDIKDYYNTINNILFGNMTVSKHVCKNNPSYSYSGKETSPLGIGYCADAESLGKEMIGKDGNTWVVKSIKGGKTWSKVNNKSLERDTPIITNIDEYKNKNDDNDNNDTVNNDDTIVDTTVDTVDVKIDEPKKRKQRKIKDNATSVNDDTIDNVNNDDVKVKPKKRQQRKVKDTTTSDDTISNNDNGSTTDDKQTEKKTRKPRVKTLYNEFISKTLKELREKHSGENIKTTEYMKMAVAEWKKIKEEKEKETNKI